MEQVAVSRATASGGNYRNIVCQKLLALYYR